MLLTTDRQAMLHRLPTDNTETLFRKIDVTV